jgi:hypothetical protein
MESRYNKFNKVEIFEEGQFVHPKIPVEHKCTTDNKQIFCRVIKAIDICCGARMVFFMVSRIQRRFLINFHLTRKTVIDKLLFGELLTSSPLLNSSKYFMGAKETGLLLRLRWALNLPAGLVQYLALRVPRAWYSMLPIASALVQLLILRGSRA